MDWCRKCGLPPSDPDNLSVDQFTAEVAEARNAFVSSRKILYLGMP